METKRPKVGVGVIVIKDGKVLLGKRKGSHGDGEWSFPGGHLEFMETVEDCARRELLEETGLTVGKIKTGPYTNDFFPVEDKHYITLFMIAKYESGEPKNIEPEKCEGWHWFDWNDLPAPLFPPIRNLKKISHTFAF